jgi:amino acid transporter
VAAQVGAWSPIGFVLIGFLSLSVALCFAELSSRFDSTGGPYLYTRAAFGDFVGFEIGWMQWFSRATSQASIMAATVVALGYYGRRDPHAARGLRSRASSACLDQRAGRRQGSTVVNVMTVGAGYARPVHRHRLRHVESWRLTKLPPITLQHR